MDVVILNRRGVASKLPNLRVGQFYFATDTKVLFIGSSTGNVAIANLSNVTDVETALSVLITNLTGDVLTKASVSHTHGWLSSNGSNQGGQVGGLRVPTFINGTYNGSFVVDTAENFEAPLNLAANFSFLAEQSVARRGRWLAVNNLNNILENTFVSSTVSFGNLANQFEINVYHGTTSVGTNNSGGNPIIGQIHTTRGVGISIVNVADNRFMGLSSSNFKRYILPIWNPVLSSFQILNVDVFVQSASLFIRLNTSPYFALSLTVRYY